MAAAKSLRALENKLQGAWAGERGSAFPLARVNIHSPAGRFRGADWGGGARWLCSPRCVLTEDSAEAGREAFSAVSCVGKREHLFLFYYNSHFLVHQCRDYQHTAQAAAVVREGEGRAC